MKKILLPLLFLLITVRSYSQDLYQVIFSGGTTLGCFTFRTDQNIILKVSEDGKLLEWGNPWQYPGYNYYPGKLQEYMGRVDYYGPEYDSTLRGKVRSIGTCNITYYSASETAEKAGKLRTIGRAILDYYDGYENKAFRGKLKAAGSVLLSYYGDYENEDIRGKLRSVGNNTLTYYTSFDDKYIRGKIKSIGPLSYLWYTQNDASGFPGTLKNGAYQQSLGGVTYIIMQ